MSEADKQPVTEVTDDQAVPGTEATGAPETKDDGLDLDALRAEYEEGTKPSTEQKTTKSDEDALIERVSARLRIETEAKEDEEKLYQAIRGELPEDLVNNYYVRGYVRERVQDDPALMKLWQERREKPSTYQKMVKTLARDFAKPFENRPDPGATEDKDAVADAVRRASKQAPEGKAPDLSKLTDGQLREYTEEKFGFSV